MKRYLVLTGIFLLLGTSLALGQVTYTVTTVPTFVINTGRSEVVGSVRITATSATGTLTVASTVQYLFPGVSCDNDNTDGIALSFDGAAALGTAAIQSVTNTSAGCVVAVTVPANLNPTQNVSYIELDGVRARIDFLGGINNVGMNVNVSLSATPSNSSLFTVPNTGVVGITAVGLEVDTPTPGIVLQCVGTGTHPELVLSEGFNGAFVQHVLSHDFSTATPLNSRPVYGGLNNTRIHINIQNAPAGMNLTWPTFVNSQLNAGAFTAHTNGSRLELDATLSTATDVVYDYVCGDQAVCDINTEEFDFTFDNPNTNSGGLHSAAITLTDSTTNYGTANITVNLNPPLVVNDATKLTDAPNLTGVATPKPRFNDPPRGPYAIATNAPCRTDLLFPWVVFYPSLGYDTGINIANTSTDPFGDPAGSPPGIGAIRQSGTCTLYGWTTAVPSAPSAPTAVTFTTPSIMSGASWANSLSQIPAFNAANFTGYIIAVCNFQYGHGFAFISADIYTDSAIGQGYVALVIPDPNIISERRACYPGVGNVNGFLTSNDVCMPQAGEGLSQ